MNTVIQVVQHLRPGGIETMALDLANIGNAGKQTLIVSLEDDSASAIGAWPRLAPYADRLIFLDKQPGIKPSLVLQLSRLFKRFDAKVVHTHHIGPLLYAGLAARLASVKHVIHTEHDAWHLNDPNRRRLHRWITTLVNPVLVADSQTVADTMQRHLKSRRIRVVYNGIDTKRFTPGDQSQARHLMGLPQNVPLIGCSGRLEEVKGQEVLIDALAKMPPETHLALAGSGTIEEKLRQQTKKLGLIDRVHFLGRIDHMPLFYQALDIFCLPSRQEGFPLSPLEAQACGIRTAVTDVGGSRETLCPDTGKLIPANNAAGMASILGAMLKRDAIRNPRKHVEQTADLRQMAQAYTDLHHAGA